MIKLIAEIGFNHEGEMPVAAEMIEEAAKAGVDAVQMSKHVTKI